MAASYVTLILDLTDATGSLPYGGLAEITPTVQLTDNVNSVVIPQAPVIVSFENASRVRPPTAQLRATDDTSIVPSGWAYTISFNGVTFQSSAAALSSFSFFLPASGGSTQYLSALSPVSTVVTQFPANPMTTVGDLIYGGVGGTPERLGIGADNDILTATNGLPVWGPPAVAAVAGIPLGALPYVKITLGAPSFSPSLTLYSGSTATLHWVYNGAVVATGVAPAITGPATGSWDLYLYATDASGFDALDQVQVFNIGYNSNNDSSPYAPSSAYNQASQTAVTGLSGVNRMRALQYLLAEQIPSLTGTVDCSGMAHLTNIELFGSSATAVNISGCGSLARLDFEACAVPAVNLNLAGSSLYDLRAAAQQDGYLQLAALNAPLVSQYHFCVRDQIVYGMPDIQTAFPVIDQLWIWNTVQAGALTVRSGSLTSLQAYENWYASADLTGQFPRVSATPTGYLDLHANQLTSVTLTGCPGLAYIDLSDNQLSQAAIDGILATVSGWGTSGGTLNLGGNAAPGTAGTADVTTLQGRSWTVTVAASGNGPVGTDWTFGENVMVRQGGSPSSVQGTLASPVNAGDLIVVAVETQSVPAVYDSAGNAYTVIGPYGTYVYLAYCLSSAAMSSGLTVTAYGGVPNGMAIGRYTPTAGAAVFGGAAGGTPSAGGLNAGTGNNLGDVGTVPAHALVWGVLFDDSTAVQSYQGVGYQSGSAGTPDAYGFTIPGPSLHGGGIVMYVLDAANADAALTWYGAGTGASSWAASAYFTA